MKRLIVLIAVLIFANPNIKVFAQDDFDETLIQAPKVDSNEEYLRPSTCRTRDHLRWDVCFNKFENGELKMKSFKFSNTGENKIVPKSGFSIGRDFEFMFEGQARSDLGLLVWDSPDEIESHGHLKLMMFFPRDIMPAIRYEADNQKDIVIVTLPTKEEVVFNGKSNELISGVLSEDPIQTDANGAALNPGFHYQGKGVMIEAHALANYPVGFAAEQAKAKVTIYKKGYAECKVPVKDLWYTDDNKGGNVLFNKKYITDAAFDKYVKSKCHFSIY